MLQAIVHRLSRRPFVPSTGPSRIEVCPPSIWPQSDALWKRMAHWLSSPGPMDGAPRLLNRLPTVRADFEMALIDIGGDASRALLDRVQVARSLRELWHLRPAMFSLISLHHCQGEAEKRMARLNRHFPTRAPRSGFMPL